MLKELSLRGCRELVSLPELPPSLRELRLRDCRKLMALPEELPPSLRVLELDDCRKLMSLPEELPPNLYTLSAFNCISLEKGISQQLLLQYMLQRHIPCIHQRPRKFFLWNRVYFAFPKDHVMDEFGLHRAEWPITVPCLPISHLRGFIYCILLSKEFVFHDILVSMYQDDVKVGSWVSGQTYKSCNNPISDHVMFWYDDISRYDKILSEVQDHSREIEFIFEFGGLVKTVKKFRVFPVHATSSGFTLNKRRTSS